jgi:CHAD domain-containing protein
MKRGLKALDGGRASDEDIHDARKRIKQARTTVRLLRKALSGDDYRRADRILRDAAHPLSAARDAKILVEALDGLQQRHRGARHIKGGHRFRRALVHARLQARRRALTDAAGVAEARKLMDLARFQAKHWTLHHDGWRQLAKRAVRRYAKGRDALREVNGERTVERLHRWRKQAKYLYLQLELLAPISTPAIARRADELHSLLDDLGEDHDLALLHRRVAEHMRDLPKELEGTALFSAIERSRRELQSRALSRGGRLYRGRPASLAYGLGL